MTNKKNITNNFMLFCLFKQESSLLFISFSMFILPGGITNLKNSYKIEEYQLYPYFYFLLSLVLLRLMNRTLIRIFLFGILFFFGLFVWILDLPYEFLQY